MFSYVSCTLSPEGGDVAKQQNRTTEQRKLGVSWQEWADGPGTCRECACTQGKSQAAGSGPRGWCEKKAGEAERRALWCQN